MSINSPKSLKGKLRTSELLPWNSPFGSKKKSEGPFEPESMFQKEYDEIQRSLND